MLFLEQQADEDDHVAPRNKIEFYQSTKPVIKKTMTGRKAAEAKAASNQKNKLNNDLQKKLMLSNESISQPQAYSQRFSNSSVSGAKVSSIFSFNNTPAAGQDTASMKRATGNFFTSLKQQASNTKRYNQTLLDSAGKPIRRRLANDNSFLKRHHQHQGAISARTSLELQQQHTHSSGHQQQDISLESKSTKLK